MAKAGNKGRAAARRAARRQAARRPKPGSSQIGSEAECSITPSATGNPAVAPRIAWWSLLALVFLVPLAIGNLTFLGFRLPFTADQYDLIKVVVLRALTLVALGAWAWEMLRRGGKLRHTPLDWLILAFLAWVALTTATALHLPTALFGSAGRYEGLLSFVNYAVIYFLVLQLAVGRARVSALAQSLFLSSLLVAGYGVLQFAGWEPIELSSMPWEANRAFATYGNPDFLGAYLIFSTTVALALALADSRLAWRLVYWTGFALNGIALIVSFTRGAWIGAAFSLALLAVIAWRQGAATRLRRLDLLPAGLAAALSAGIIWRSLSNSSEVMNFGKRMGSIFEFGSGSGRERTEIWRGALAAIEERPILGWGAETFRIVFPRFKPVDYVRRGGVDAVADNAHDYPLHLAAGVGIPGALLLYSIFVWAAVRSFATVFARRDEPSHLVLGAFWAASAGYLLQLLFGLSLPGVTFLLWVALGVLLSPTAKVVNVRAPRWGTAAAAIVASLCLVGIGYQGILVAADHAYLTAHLAESGPARTAAASRATTLNPYSGTYRAELGRAHTEEAQGYYEAARGAQQAGRDPSDNVRAMAASFASAESTLKDTIEFMPDEYYYYLWLADLYNLGGDMLDIRYYDEAVAVARRGIELDPNNPMLRVQLARALLSTNRIDEGIQELEYALQLNGSYAETALLLAQAYEVTGRPDKALALLKSVEAASPGQPGVAEAIQRLEGIPPSK